MVGAFTFAMIKPDAVQKKQVGEIIAMIEQAGFTIQAMRLMQLTPAIAGALYKAHKGRSYYEPMCAFVASGPIVAMVLDKENAVAHFDRLKEAIRKRFTTSRTHNAIHGADTMEAASRETSLFVPTINTQNLEPPIM